MGCTAYHEADIEARGNSRAARVEVWSPGATVLLLTRTSEPGTKDTERTTAFEMTPAETLALIEGLIDALSGRCGVPIPKADSALRALRALEA